MIKGYRRRRRALRASFRTSRRALKLAFRRAFVASRKAITNAVKAKKTANARGLKKAWKLRRRSFVANLRNQRRKFLKAVRALRLKFRRGLWIHSKKYRRRTISHRTAKCVVNQCSRVKCKSGFACRHVRRFTKQFRSFIRQKRALTRSYFASHRRIVLAYRKQYRQASRNFRKYAAKHRYSFRRARSVAAKRRLRTVFRGRLRGYRRSRGAAFRQYRRAVKLARRNYLQRLRSLRKKQGKATFRNRVKTVARCIRRVTRSCRRVRCSSGKRCVVKTVPTWWFRLYRISIRRAYKRFHSRLRRAIRRLRRRHRVNRRFAFARRYRRRFGRASRGRKGSRRALKSFSFWLKRAFRRIRISKRLRTRRARKSKRNLRKFVKRMRKTRSRLWGRFRKAAKRYRKRFRNLFKRLSGGKRRGGKSSRRVPKAVVRKFKKNEKKYARRVFALKRWFGIKLRLFESLHKKSKKATATKKKAIRSKMRKLYRRISKVYRSRLRRAVVSYYKRKSALAASLRRKIKRATRRLSRHKGRRFVRRAMCVAKNPCHGKRCRRGYRCKVRKIRSKSGRTSTIGRCERRPNPCSRIRCSKGRRCIVRRIPTRTFRLYRLYARISRNRFSLRARRLRRRLSLKRRRRAARAIRRNRRLRRFAARRLRGKRLATRFRNLRWSLKRALRKYRRRSTRSYRRLRNKLRLRLRRTVRRYYRRLLRHRRRYTIRTVCAARPTNPCSKKRCPSGSRCVARRLVSRLYRRFRAITRRRLRRYAIAKRRLAKISGKRRATAARRLKRSLKRRLRKIWRVFKRRGAFRRTRRLVARCYRPGKACPSGYRRRGRTCVNYYRVCPRAFTMIRNKRGSHCIKFNRICKSGKFLFNGRCWRKCPKGTRRSSSRSCKLAKTCPSFMYRTRCVKSCPRNFVAVGRRCRQCPRNSYRRGRNCYSRRIYCRSGFAYRGRCRSRCPAHTFARGRRCIRARCPKGSKARLSIRRGRIICIKRRGCKRGLVYYAGSCKSRCPSGTRRRRWYCQKICKKGFIRVGFRRQRCIRGYCYNKFRIGRSCVRKCPIGYIGIRRSCRRVSITCPSGYVKLGRVLCMRSCPAGFTKRGRRCVYSSCKKGQFRYRGTCMKGCPAGTKRRGSYCFKRSKCRFGRFLYGKLCLVRCPPGHYRSFARRSCIRIKRCRRGLLRFRRLCLKTCPLGFRRKRRSCTRSTICRNGKMYRGVCIVTRCPRGTHAIRGACVRTPRLCPSGRLLLIRSNGARSCVRACPRTYTVVRSKGSCKPTRCPKGTYRLGIECRKTCPKGFTARRGRCRKASRSCRRGLFRFRRACVKSCPKGFTAGRGRCWRVPFRCSKGKFRFRKSCVKKCPKNYTGRVYKRARRAAIRYCRRIRNCKKGQVLIYRRSWSRFIRRSRYRSRCVSARKPCRTGFTLRRRLVRFNRGGKKLRRVIRLCRRARVPCAKGLFLFRAKCRKQCPRGMRTLLVRRSKKVIRTCTPKCGTQFALRNKCVRRCPSGYSARRFGRIKFCKKDCSRGQFSFRGTCITRCPTGYRKRTYRVYSRRSRKLIATTSCAKRACSKGYQLVYRLKRTAKGRSFKLTGVCRRVRQRTCRYPTALAFGRCYRRCPSGYTRRSRVVRGRRLGYCLPTIKTILCRRIRCSKSKTCVIKRRVKVFRTGKRAVRRAVRKAICVPRFCKAGTYRFKHRCVRNCPRGYTRRSSKRFRMHKGRKLAYSVRLCTRKLCKYPMARYGGRCVKSCPSSYEKKVYSFRFRYRKSKFMKNYAVCRRNLCSKVSCSRNQKCVIKTLAGRKIRQVAVCASKNPCSRMRCRRGFSCQIRTVAGRKRPSCIPRIPFCKAGLVGFGRRCQRRCPKNHRVLSKRIGGRLYRLCARDACTRRRFFSAGRCVQRCPSGFVGKAIRYSKSYSFKYCAPKSCKRRLFRLGVRCLRSCPSGYHRRYFRTRRGVRRYCASSACKAGTYKLGKRCVKSCPKNYTKKTVRRGTKSFGACVPKRCPKKSVFIWGRCRKALKGCYDRTFACRSLSRRKKCSKKLVKYLCPVSCGTCNPKKRKLCTCTSMGDPHYRTFDGQWLHFMGKCKYLLAKSKLSKSSKCNFSVTAKNEVRGKKRNVSWTRYVDINIHGFAVRLHQRHRVYLNGKRVRKLPISLYKNGKKLRMYRSGGNVVVESKYCGLYLEFNGRSVAELHLPKSRFANKVEGICGNCNGNPKDDLRTRSGKDVSKLGSKGFVQIGQSYLVADSSAKSARCKVSPVSPSKCSGSLKRKVRSSKFCGRIINKKGPFRACLNSGKVDHAKLFKNCEFDVCQYRKAKNRRRAVCQSVEALYNACLAKGFRVSWRRRQFCPLKCGANSVFRRNASGCPKTCADIGRRRKCRLPSREGCICKEGFVLNGKKCVPEATCGKVTPLDLAFVVDGTDDVSTDEFETLKNMIIKLLTKYRLSFNSVRPAVAVFGRTTPTVSLFSERPEKPEFMAFVRELKKPGGSADNLDAALRVANMVIMKPIGGARPEVPKYIILLKKSTVPASAESAVRSELEALKKAGVRVIVVALPPRKPGKTEASIGGLTVIPARVPPYLTIPKITKELEKTAGCAAGYKKQGKRCRDVNECAAKVPPCHSDSTCVNLPGSFICLCRAGFRHDRSRGCVSLKEEKCPAKPKCDNGYYFEKSKGKCVDIDECKEKPCLGDGATCVNTPGSFKCNCKTGYEYNKYFGCVDIDECKGKDPCAGSGKCINTLGSFKCACDEGYTYKTGLGCKDIDECATGAHNCKGRSKCINTVGSFNCSCGSGYRYVSNDCVDIDECAEDSKLCDASATCVNRKPGYECECKLGSNWVHKPGMGCVPDEKKGMSMRKVDFIFTIDGSDKLKASEKDIKDFLSRLLNEFTAKELKGLSVRASAVVMGKSGTAEIKFSQSDLSGIDDKIKAMEFPGGKADLLEGLKKASEEQAKARNGSTPIVFLITGSNIAVGDVKLPDIKRLSDNFKSTGKFFTVQITPAREPADWSALYSNEEISHFVTVIRSTDISTIYKLIYKRIYPLINCPDGFVKISGLCQLQTGTIKYCKTDDDQLRPLGSTWQEECSEFKCSDSGVEVVSRKCLGYDGQCYSTEEYFPCTQVTGSLSWKCRCKLFSRTNKKGKKVEALHYQSIATSDEKVLTENGRACVFPFKYQNKWLYNCDEYNGRYWCSYHRMHETGSWGYCKIKESKNRCTDPFNPSKVYIEGERWNHGCNVMECTNTGLKRIPKCEAVDKTCKALNEDSYSCHYEGKLHKNCICVQDSAGWGKNEVVSGDKAKDVSSSGGSVISVCVDRSSGNRYEQGQEWTNSCFKYKCTATGGELLLAQCQQKDGKCRSIGDKGFDCVINGKSVSDCMCDKDSAGNPTLSAVVSGLKVIEVLKVSEVSTSLKTVAKSVSSSTKK